MGNPQKQPISFTPSRDVCLGQGAPKTVNSVPPVTPPPGLATHVAYKQIQSTETVHKHHLKSNKQHITQQKQQHSTPSKQ